MASTIRLELVTPERLVFSEDVDEVIVPGYEGELGVLPEHTQYLSIVNAGVLCYRKGGGGWSKIAISGGVAEIMPEQVAVLAETAERAEEINLERANRAKERAESEIKEALLNSADRYARAEAALKRAIARISAVE